MKREGVEDPKKPAPPVPEKGRTKEAAGNGTDPNKINDGGQTGMKGMRDAGRPTGPGPDVNGPASTRR